MRTRWIGIALLFFGLGIAAWLVTGLIEATNQKNSITGHVLGLAIFCMPFIAVALYLLLSSRGEIKEESKADKERAILGAVMTRGRVSVADLAIEGNLTREQVRDYIYDIIGKDLFRGYVNWEKGELVSAEAAQIKADTCPNCGGKVELAGKGLVRCPFCGTETYLSPPSTSIKSVHARESAPAQTAPAQTAPMEAPEDASAGEGPAAPSADQSAQQ
jgi:DNA-directed RNA polymerase subunit RPC12/RpoP